MNIYAVTIDEEDYDDGPVKIERLKTEILFLNIEKRVIEQKIQMNEKQIKELEKENEI